MMTLAILTCADNVGDDCPIFDGLFEYCSISAGGSMGGWLDDYQTDPQRALRVCHETSAISLSIGRADCTMQRKLRLVDSVTSMVSFFVGQSSQQTLSWASSNYCAITSGCYT